VVLGQVCPDGNMGGPRMLVVLSGLGTVVRAEGEAPTGLVTSTKSPTP
jgi:hypothetical protein